VTGCRRQQVKGKKVGLRKYSGWSLTGSKTEERAQSDLQRIKEREKEWKELGSNIYKT
jgi:hypothetical protein